MFDSIEARPPDPILGLSAAYKKDTNPNKVDLGVGVYKDESGNCPVMAAVKTAERRKCEEEDSKAYIAQAGPELYIKYTSELLLGNAHPVLRDGRSSCTLAPGGSGSLRLAAEFVNNNAPGTKIYVSDPSWANHVPLLSSSGLKLELYPYYNYETHSLNFDAMMDSLKNATKGDLVLLHGCCHNPCGADLNADQWQAVTDLSLKNGFTPFIDVAYQGLGDGLDEDAYGMRLMAEKLPELIIASSYSKNFGLYRDRVGAVTMVTANSESCRAVASQVVATAREIYSVPPAHGAFLVAMILDDAELTKVWNDELTEMRDRINGLRRMLVEKLKEIGVEKDFSFIQNEKGLFSFLGLSKEQVATLVNDYSIYLVGSSRINVAGINNANIDYLAQSIAKVL
ncbi:aspartate/tyrosine/aromatic aminotransferase [Gammaproteobacteria bacterium]|jgi:aspartate aminotransferase|nr:aspartate/tyrosine/aromatic aminotransferase [Gammaproteobacteria bacterium]